MIGVEAVPAFCCFARGNGVFLAGKIPKVKFFSAYLYFGAPFSSRLKQADAKRSACVKTVHALILLVFRARHVSKVLYSVIGAISVDVVNVVFRPLTIKNCPCRSMRKHLSPQKTSAPITAIVDAMQCWFSSVSIVPESARMFGASPRGIVKN